MRFPPPRRGSLTTSATHDRLQARKIRRRFGEAGQGRPPRRADRAQDPRLPDPRQAQASIEPERGPSRPGQPPHTHTATRTKKGKPRGKGRLPKAILYAVETDPDRVVIGPSKNLIGTVGQAFEHEGEVQYKGRNYPPRPFMAPALALEAPKLPGFLIEQLDKIK